MRKGSKNVANPSVVVEFKWYSPFLGLIIIIGLPGFIIAINTVCNDVTCNMSDLPYFKLNLIDQMNRAVYDIPWAVGLILIWLVLHILMYIAPFGTRVFGPLRNGISMAYHLNGFLIFIGCHVSAFIIQITGLVDLGILADHFFGLLAASLIVAISCTIFISIASIRQELSVQGTSGQDKNYNLCTGNKLLTGELDLTFVCDRPGLIGWSLINWAHVVRAEANGTGGIAIWLIAVFEMIYVADTLLYESNNIPTDDIIYGVGYKQLVWSLSFVPFVCSIKTRFLLHFPQYHPDNYVILACAMMAVGYILFRGSLNDRDRFRRNPKDPRVGHLKIIRSSSGKPLIISGFWSICRYPHYVGEWMMTFSWSLLTGTIYAFPYCQPVYLAGVLISRHLHDERTLQEEEGKDDWDKFCKCVPTKMVPLIY
eukprot:Tbor_TRINITY_DN3675_c1_g1::TRINITY_DN3675_c1_g1_i1::g.234::m.234